MQVDDQYRFDDTGQTAASRLTSSQQSSSPQSSTATTKSGSGDAFRRLRQSHNDLLLEGGADGADGSGDSSDTSSKQDSTIDRLDAELAALEEAKAKALSEAADWYVCLRHWKKNPKRKHYKFTDFDGELPEMVGDKRRVDVENALSAIIEQLSMLENKEREIEDERRLHLREMKRAAAEDEKGAARAEYDEEKDTTLQKAAGDEFLIWEPKGSSNKGKACLRNALEVLCAVVVAILSLVWPSTLSACYFISMMALLYTATLDLSSRYFYGIIVLACQTVLIIIFITVKIFAMGGIQQTLNDRGEFMHQIAKYSSLGYDLEIDPNQLKKGAKGPFHTNVGGAGSFTLEGVVVVMLLVTIFLFYKQYRRLKNLRTTQRWKFVKLIRLESPQNDGSKQDIGTVGRAARENLAQEMAKRKEELQTLRRDISKSYIGSTWYYKKNQLFYVLAIFVYLLQSMVFNAVLDLPTLLILLIIIGAYPIRKDISIEYRALSFILVYVCQLALTVKLVHDIIVRIQFVDFYLRENPKSNFAKFNDIVFGGKAAKLASTDAAFFYYAGTLVSFICCQQWKTVKWWEVREKTPGCDDVSSFTRFYYYLQARDKSDQSTKKEEARWEARSRKAMKAKREKSSREKAKIRQEEADAKANQIVPEGKRYDPPSAAKMKARSSVGKFLPFIILNASRVLMFFMCYTYHSGISFINLGWLVLSFIISRRATLLYSIALMIPLLTWEFSLVFGSRTPIIKDTFIFATLGDYFQFDMKSQGIEQAIMFITLASFYAQAGCYVLETQARDENPLLAFFRRRIHGSGSGVWKYIFQMMPHVQTIVLIVLFANGISDVNKVRNLVFVLFFVVYTAYYEVYRRTSIALVLFVSFFILGQYAVSLFYKVFLTEPYDPTWISRLYQLGLFYSEFDRDDVAKDPYGNTENTSLYWRIFPVYSNWFLLVATSSLHTINSMLNGKDTKNDAKKLMIEAADKTRKSNEKLVYYMNRIGTWLKTLLILVVVCGMLVAHGIIETDVISWVFFTLNFVNMAYLVKGDSSKRSVARSLCISNAVKGWALFVLVAQVLFSTVIMSGKNDPNSLDQKFKRRYPGLYESLDIIGLRTSILRYNDYSHLTEKEQQKLVKKVQTTRLIIIVVFFLSSVMLSAHFRALLTAAEEEEAFGEEDYKKLFEYTDVDSTLALDSRHKKDVRVNSDSDSGSDKIEEDIKRNATEYVDEQYLDDLNESLEQEDDDQQQRNKAEGLESSIYKKKTSYKLMDLFLFYEGTRFTTPFMAYRAMDWWPLLDRLARWGHVFYSAILVGLALFQTVSFLMCFHLVCVCAYYQLAVGRLASRARFARERAGLRSQCDIRMASIITKDFRREAFYEFLSLRSTLWNIQFGVFILSTCLGYPTELLYKLRQKPDTTPSQQQAYDWMQLWAFLLGIFNDGQKENKNMFYLFSALQLLGLVIEKKSIEWLTNRLGCTYFKLQKFIELDVRREAIRYSWDRKAPIYEPKRYQEHYFLNDFDDLYTRFLHRSYKQVTAAAEQDRRERLERGEQCPPTCSDEQAAYEKQLFGDFVPHKVARRIRDTVKFSTMLACRAPELNIDPQSKDLLDEDDAHKCRIYGNRGKGLRRERIARTANYSEGHTLYDYESIKVLRDHKISQLEKILKTAVDFKYRVSLGKGARIAIESFILLAFMMSLVYKSNIFSIVYLVFIVRYMTAGIRKMDVIIRINWYMGVAIITQYALIVVNLTCLSSPQNFPIGYKHYPQGRLDANGSPQGLIPWLYHYPGIRDDVLVGNLLGVGIAMKQTHAIAFDFAIMIFMSMYILNYSNPVLSARMRKVFWQFPQRDSPEQWARLEPEIQQQVDWLYMPVPLTTADKYEQASSNFPRVDLDRKQIALAQDQYHFAYQYNQINKQDLNYLLTTYVDLKYAQVWSEEFLKEKKWEMKDNSHPFRVVKQGSVLVYLSLHVVMIFIILLMATMRQSYLALIYVLILAPFLKDGAEVLKQRDMQLQRQRNQVEDEMLALEVELAQDDSYRYIYDQLTQNMDGPTLTRSMELELRTVLSATDEELDPLEKKACADLGAPGKPLSRRDLAAALEQYVNRSSWTCDQFSTLCLAMVAKYRAMSSDRVKELKGEIIAKKNKVEELTATIRAKGGADSSDSEQEAEDEMLDAADLVKAREEARTKKRQKQAAAQWRMITVVAGALRYYAIMDLILQVIFQLPIVGHTKAYEDMGFRKINSIETNSGTPIHDLKFPELINKYGTDDQVRLMVNVENLAYQIMNCVIIAAIVLQTEVFHSSGYTKFVTQSGGSMDLLMALADTKAKTIAQCRNNYKIRKILSLQRRRDTILQTVDRIREKLVRWRKFTRTTLVVDEGASFKDNVADDAKLETSQPRTSLFADSTPLPRELKKQTGDGDLIDKHDSADEANVPASDEEVDENSSVRREAKKMIKKVAFEQHITASNNKMRLTQEQSKEMCERLADEFVEDKMAKMRCTVRLYIWLTKTLTEQIMFKNKHENLKALKQRIAGGEINVPTELENIMRQEAFEIVSKHYDHSEGAEELAALLRRRSLQGKTEKRLIEFTDLSKQNKLSRMPKTYEYTRPGNMLLHYAELFFQIIISQTQNLAYLAMLFSMMQNQGLIGLFYPLAVFGYALLEETRPGSHFWKIVHTYTTIILVIKFVFNLSGMEAIIKSDVFQETKTIVKLGIFDYSDLADVTFYIMPEILIITMIMLNQIKLRLIGLYDKNEDDVEPIFDAIQRNLMGGDEERVQQKRLEQSNMFMARYFESRENNIQDRIELRKADIRAIAHDLQHVKSPEETAELMRLHGVESRDKERLAEKMYEAQQENEPTGAEAQQLALAATASRIWKTSTKFDLDTAGKKSKFDTLIAEGVVRKTLESDELLFVEGARDDGRPGFVSRREMTNAMRDQENWDNMSAGDFNQDFEDKREALQERQRSELGWFESSAYFARIFPSARLQKPGYDLYAVQSLALAAIALFVWVKSDEYTASTAAYSYMAQQSSLFQVELAVVLVVIITVLVAERIVSRTDTKKVVEATEFGGREVGSGGQNPYYEQDEIFHRTQTMRSMTVKVKTMKTSDLDMGSQSAQKFLQEFENGDGSAKLDEGQTKVTNQQKVKIIMHWTVLVIVHIYVFYYVPLHSAITMYGSARCDPARAFYGCKDFGQNWALRVLYVLCAVYLWLSARQISLGFPIQRISSSLFQSEHELAIVAADIVQAIPFCCELRCLLDWVLSKTSLDWSQNFALFYYHLDLYKGYGNDWYVTKVLGEDITCFEKATSGCLFVWILLIVLVGPFILFASFSPLVGDNPVAHGRMALAIQSNKSVITDAMTGQIYLNDPLMKTDHNQKLIRQDSSVNYQIYSNKNLYLSMLQKEQFNRTHDYYVTETSWFTPGQEIQVCRATPYPDTDLDLSATALKQMLADVELSRRIAGQVTPDKEHQKPINISLQFQYEFVRPLPENAEDARLVINRTLNYSQYDDCMAGEELASWTQAYEDCHFNTSFTRSVYIRHAYNPKLVLGMTKQIETIKAKQQTLENQLYDMKLSFECVKGSNKPIFTVMTKQKARVYSANEVKAREVHPQNCSLKNADFNFDAHYVNNEAQEFINDYDPLQVGATIEELTSNHDLKQVAARQLFEDERTDDVYYSNWTVILFNLRIMTSLLAGWSPSVFYASVALVLGSQVQVMFRSYVYAAPQEQLAKPRGLMKLFEAVHLHRHEEKLHEEEECFCMIMEIIRSPELLRAMTGSRARGLASPELDGLSKKQRDKLKHLDQLQAKGFDVELLKEQITRGQRIIYDDDL